MKSYNWKQSDFVKNCPIYYVKEDGKNFLMRIEYDVLGKSGTWQVEALNGFSKISIPGHMNESERIKKIAEKTLRKTLKELTKTK